MFPFEVNYEGKFIDNFLGNIFLILTTLFLISFYSTFDQFHNDGIAIFILISGILSSVFNAMLFFIPLKHLKVHIFVSSFAIVFGFMLNASSFLANLISYQDNQIILNLIGAIISGILALSLIVLIMNPKLSLLIKGKEEKLDNGEIVVKRPNWIALAFTEWVTIFSIFLNCISILFYIISLH